MIAQKNGGDPNEQFLFHGSKTNAYDTIIREGFDIRVANMASSIGVGIYFGVNASISKGYVSGEKKMFYARVCLGEYCPILLFIPFRFLKI